MSALISATVSLVVFVVCIGAYAATRPDVNAVARAYFAYGYARGQQDVLEGATIVGEADQYKLPPITREQLIAWRQARYTAVQTLEAAK